MSFDIQKKYLEPHTIQLKKSQHFHMEQKHSIYYIEGYLY